ncbi:MAG: VOC family protein [Planctomycetes bacterium]|nr:VOC family protein [Planctomycetota bacterium]MCW8137080.1 VOC family protein [Planctomycetota bacterium]
MAANLEKGIPVLPADDVEATAAFYRDKLGFTEAFRDATPASYVGMRRDEVEVHFAGVTGGIARTIGEQTMCRFVVDDVDQLYAEYKQHDVIHPNGHLQNKPWGTREFGVIDPTGVCLTFYKVNTD